MIETSQYNTCRFCGLSMGEHEHSCPHSDENINPEVYRVEDGHRYMESPWPSLEGMCSLCGHAFSIHMEG